jgi:hypothetical protein
MIELTKEEMRFAQVSAKRCHQLICRKHSTIGWVGVALFGLGLPPFIAVSWLRSCLTTIGFSMLMLALLGLAMSAAGKLYKQVQSLEREGRAEPVPGDSHQWANRGE